MDFTTVALWIVGAFALMWVVRFVVTGHRLLRIRLRPAQYEPVAEETISDEVRGFLEPPGEELRALGFELVGYARMQPMVAIGDAPPKIAAVYYYAPSFTLAYVGASELAIPFRPHSIAFSNRLADRRFLLGMNGEAWARIADTSRTECFDPYAPSTALHWQAYQARLEELSRSGAGPVPVEDWIASANAHGLEFLKELEGLGVTEPAEAGMLQLRFVHAFGLAARMLREASRLRPMMIEARKLAGGAAAPEVPVELEMEVYLRTEAARVAGSGRGGALYFVLAMLAAVAIGAFGVIEPRLLAIVVVVVLFHEAGHYAAMRAFGYKDTTIYLIPFFGGAATGSKENIALHEDMIVLLAGPVPGILVSIGLALAGPFPPHGWETELIRVLAVINAINLLPIYPLDGGKIVDGLLARGRPFFAAAIRVAAVLVFAVFAFALQDFISILLAAVCALSLKFSISVARVEKAVLLDGAIAQEINPLRRTLERMRSLGMGGLAPATRMLITRQVMQRINRAPQSALSTVAWCAVYACSLGAGALGLVASVFWAD